MRSLPEFVSRRKDVHFFKWATKYGCSLPKSAMPEIIEEFAFTDSGSDSDSNSDGDKPPDGSELQPPSTHESRRNAATIFLIAMCVYIFHSVEFKFTGITQMYHILRWLPDMVSSDAPHRTVHHTSIRPCDERIYAAAPTTFGS